MVSSTTSFSTSAGCSPLRSKARNDPDLYVVDELTVGHGLQLGVEVYRALSLSLVGLTVPTMALHAREAEIFFQHLCQGI